MDLRHPTTIADRFALGFAGGCIGLVLGGLFSFAFSSWAVVWYSAAYFALVCFVLGPVAADVVALVFAAIALLSVSAIGGIPHSAGYERNPFNKPWHWALLGLFFVGFAGVLLYAKDA